MIQVSVDPSRVTRKLQKLQDGLGPGQVASAMNASIQSSRAFASRLARTVVNLKPKTIYQDARKNTPANRSTGDPGDLLLMYRAEASRSGRSGQSASLYFTSKRPDIADFGAKARPGGGVTAVSWRGLGRERFASAWQKTRKMQADPKLARRWYVRTGEKRFPIRRLRGPSLADVMGPAKGLVIGFASKRMEIEYQRKIRGVLSRG